MELNQDEQHRRTAVHEASHAFATLALGGMVDLVSVRPTEQ